VLIDVTKITKLVNLATSIRKMLIVFTVNQNKNEVAFVKEIFETGVM
jgi:tRNA splicing endonuclease